MIEVPQPLDHILQFQLLTFIQKLRGLLARFMRILDIQNASGRCPIVTTIRFLA